MFDLAEARLVWIPVRWNGVKQEEPDKLAVPTEWEIECQVEIVSKEADPEVSPDQRSLSIDEIFGSEANGTPGLPTDLEKFKALVRDWRRVKMGSTSAPMNDENISKMLRVPMFAQGFEASYLQAWMGQLEAREKNSGSSPGDGRAQSHNGSAATPAKAA